MIDLSTLPVPEGCPIVTDRRPESYGNDYYSHKARFLACAGMELWLDNEEYAECAKGNIDSANQLQKMKIAWRKARIEAYQAIKEKSK